MKVMKKLLCLVMVAVMMIALIPGNVEAKSRVALNKKKVTLTITNKNKNPKVTLKVKGVSKKVAKKAKWTTSNKKVATVKKGKVTAKKAGKATITCKVRGKKYKCRVTVKDKRKPVKSGTLDVTIVEKASETGLGPILPLHVSDEAKRQISGSVKIENIPDPVPDGGEPYMVNKIKVTYNGKDVTNEAKYEIDEPQVARITSPGAIELTNRGMIFKLTVSYNGVEKTFTMGKTVVTDSYSICYCGAVFDCGECNNGNCLYCKHFRQYHCAGCWIGPYMKYIDLRIK